MKVCGNSRHLACDIPFPLPRRLSPLPGVPTSIRFSHKEYAMDPILILIADQARARILMSETRASSPMEISDLVNPQGRAHEGDLITGETGTTSGRPHIDHANYHPTYTENNALERAAEEFAININTELERLIRSHHPARIHVIAPPKFLGLLRAKRSKPVQALIEEEITKDISKLSLNEIREHLPDFV